MPIVRATLLELHYIAAIENIPSILERGILSNRKARPLAAISIANAEVQAIREEKHVPQGLPLHDYANLYFDARNPMMYARHSRHRELSVLRISPDVLDLPRAIIADGNAASADTAFWPSPSGLVQLDSGLVFAEWWTDPDFYVKREKTRVRCAELLVPDEVPPGLIIGAYASCTESELALSRLAPTLTVKRHPHLFFAGPPEEHPYG